MATKNITVTGSMNTSADLAALVAGGDISITGQGTTTSSFQGLILAEGSFKAKDTTLIGSALTLDKNGSVQLERVRTVAARDLTKIDLSYAVKLKEATKKFDEVNFTNVDKVGVFYNNEFTILNSDHLADLEEVGKQIATNGGNSDVVVRKPNGDIVYMTDPEFANVDPSILKAFDQGEPRWRSFEKDAKTNTIQYVDVFQLDFNKFLKTKGGLRPLIQRVSQT